MKIHFTKKEYYTLLQMLYMADWMAHAHAEERPQPDESFKTLAEKVLALADEAGIGEMVETNPQTGQHFPSKQFVESSQVMKRIEEFENATFWEELLERLARRDFIRAYGREAILDMSIEDRFAKEMVFHQRYDTEFAAHGLDNLEIVAVPEEQKPS